MGGTGMQGQDLRSGILLRRGVSPFDMANDDPAVSQIIDMQGFHSALFAIFLGSLADAAFTVVVLLEEGDDSGLSDAAAVADVDMSPGSGGETGAGFTEASDNQVRSVEYIGIKRFCRLTITPTGNASALLIAVGVLMGAADVQPVTQT